MPAPPRILPPPVLAVDQLNDCLRRVQEAEKALAETRDALVSLRSGAALAGMPQCQPCVPDVVEPVVAEQALALPVLSAQPAELEEKLDSKEMEKDGDDDDDDKKDDIDRLARMHGMTIQSVKTCKETFTKGDKDGDGKVDMAELVELMKEAYGQDISETQIQEAMQMVDHKEEGALDFEEFLVVFGNTPLANLSLRIDEMGKGMQDAKEYEQLTAAEKATSMGVADQIVIHWLKKELREASACMQLPVAMLLFFFFSWMVFTHFPFHTLHGIDHAIVFDLEENANFGFSGAIPFDNGRTGHKNFYDVNNHADFWSWMDLGLVPQIWMEGWGVGEARTNALAACQSHQGALLSHGWNVSWLRNASQVGGLGAECPEGHDDPVGPVDFYGTRPTQIYLYYYVVLGGMRLRQERHEPLDCQHQDLPWHLYSGRCVPGEYNWLPADQTKAVNAHDKLHDQEGGQTEYLFSNVPQADIRLQLRRLENQAWLSPLTSRVDVFVPLYNPHAGVLTGTFISMFINAGGHYYKIIEPCSVYLDPYPKWWSYIPDLAWALLIMKICLEEGRDIFDHVMEFGVKRGLLAYLAFSNAVDWVCVIYSFVIVMMWIYHLVNMERLQELIAMADVGLPGSWAHAQDRIDFFDEVEYLLGYTLDFRMVLAFYPFLIVSRFMKAFNSQPRLSLVTKTLGKASVDIIHFGTVFGTVFLLFACSSMILFGEDILEFSDMTRAIQSTFRIMLGDFDWETLKFVGWFPSGLWFWSFIWLVNFVMLNMLIALIMDIYTEVKGDVGAGGDTMWSQTAEIITRKWNARIGKMVCLDKILLTLDPEAHTPTEDDAATILAATDLTKNLLTVNEMQRRFPTMDEAQAYGILINAMEWHEGMCQSSNSLTDSTRKIASIEKMTKQVRTNIEDMSLMSSMSSALLTNSFRSARADVRKVQASCDRNCKHIKALEKLLLRGMGSAASTPLHASRLQSETSSRLGFNGA